MSRISVVLAGSLASMTLSVAGPSTAQDRDRSSEDPLSNTGVSAQEVPVAELSPDRKREIDDKAAKAGALATELRGAATSTDGTVTICPPGEDCSGPPTDYAIPAARSMTIHTQNKSYTCGPASLRNMVLILNKVHAGTYSAQSEATYEDWLGTTREGTAIGAIVNVLNNRYGHYGSWRLVNPPDKYAFLSYVVTNTYGYKQPLIHGVKTGYLQYFRGHDLNHFNVSYGYIRSTATKYIRVGEVWDPVKIYGSATYDPHGHQKPSLSELFTANDRSCPNCSDRRRLIV